MNRVAVLLIAVTVSGLSACGGEKPPSATATAPLVHDAEQVSRLFHRDEDADAGSADIRVTEVTDPQPAEGPIKPRRGRRFVAVTLRITSKVDEPLSYGPGQFQILDSSRSVHDDPKSFDGATVAPGRAVIASMVFEVPVREQDIRLVVDPPDAGGQAVEIELAD